MEALARLNGEKAQLVEGGRDGEAVIRAGDLDILAFGVLLSRCREQAQGTAPLGLPGCVGVGQVEDVAEATASDDIIVAQEVAALGVDVNGHVGLLTAQLAGASHGGQVLAEPC